MVGLGYWYISKVAPRAITPRETPTHSLLAVRRFRYTTNLTGVVCPDKMYMVEVYRF